MDSTTAIMLRMQCDYVQRQALTLEQMLPHVERTNEIRALIHEMQRQLIVIMEKVDQL